MVPFALVIPLGVCIFCLFAAVLRVAYKNKRKSKRVIDGNIFFLSVRVRTRPVKEQQSKCLICSDPVYDKLLECAKCQTLYHDDCLDYMGGYCSRYGCI